MTRIAPFSLDAVAQRHPRRDNVRRLQSPIGEILAPGDKARIPRLLDEEAAAPDQNVGADHLLDRIKHAGMADEFVKPGQKQMRLVAQPAGPAPVPGLAPSEMIGAADRTPPGAETLKAKVAEAARRISAAIGGEAAKR
jgi:hypothetical protein